MVISLNAFWLFVLFMCLKLANVIDWSWLWITAPLWGGLALAVAFGLLWATIWTLVKKATGL
jgi:hypothetical protein